MLPQEIIRKKRDRKKLMSGEIKEFISGVTDGRVTEGQAASFCMAVFFNGLDMDERVALTQAMAESGRTLDWSGENLPGPILDKHSTGGIGDKTSLILAPVIAACGGFVPMISGRGLGHTGGTLDKMDSIPGYASQPDLEKFRHCVREAGCAIIGATSDLAPADRRLYAIRDVTATVESLDLITASILSKKMAAGLGGLVMDVKFGSGAFMKDYKDATALAQSIVGVANGGGLPTVGLLTDMNQVLGTTAGNAVEVKEAVDFLNGKTQNPRLKEVTYALCAELLVLGGLAANRNEALEKIAEVVDSGKAAEHFGKMVHALGGPADFVKNPEKHLKAAPVALDVFSDQPGYVSAVDAYEIGIGIVEMGGGRARPSDIIDHAVGLINVIQIGEKTDRNHPLATIMAATTEKAEKMAQTLKNAIRISAQAPPHTPLIRDRLTAN